MTVDIFGVQSVQAVATALAAAIVLLSAVLLVAATIARSADEPFRARVLLPVTAPLMPARTDVRTSQRLLASLPSRAPPRMLHRPDRNPPPGASA